MKRLLNELHCAEGDMLLADKPYGWTSFAVVAQWKKWTRAKIGHAGTLDPLASGLMILCTGSWTKKLTQLLGLPKEYTGIIRLGTTTPTYDLESMPENPMPFEQIDEASIRQLIQERFTGNIEQYPPHHSAIKQEGKPLYELARKGQAIEVKQRQVQITEWEIDASQLPEIHFRVVCSSGTYIRSLAHDIGQALGCGAFLQALRRTAIGPYRIEDAITMEEARPFYGSAMQARIISPKAFFSTTHNPAAE